jgi:hypothetical protein
VVWCPSPTDQRQEWAVLAREGATRPAPDPTMARFLTATRHDPDAFRGMLDTVLCLAHTPDVLARPAIQAAIRAHANTGAPPIPGPDRTQLLGLLAAQVSAAESGGNLGIEPPTHALQTCGDTPTQADCAGQRDVAVGCVAPDGCRRRNSVPSPMPFRPVWTVNGLESRSAELGDLGAVDRRQRLQQPCEDLRSWRCGRRESPAGDASSGAKAHS